MAVPVAGKKGETFKYVPTNTISSWQSKTALSEVGYISLTLELNEVWLEQSKHMGLVTAYKKEMGDPGAAMFHIFRTWVAVRHLLVLAVNPLIQIKNVEEVID